MPKPSIGRIVHFVMPTGQHRPAIITHVWGPETAYDPDDEVVNMTIFPDGQNDNRGDGVRAADTLVQWGTSITHDEDGKPGTWHWPERTA